MLAGKHQEKVLLQRLGGGGQYRVRTNFGGKIFQEEGDLRHCVQNMLLDYGNEGKKVKVTLVQALRLCTGRTAHRGCRGIALPFHDHGTRRR